MRLGRITGPYLLLTLVLVGSTPSTRAQLGLGDIPALEDGIPIKTVDAFRFQLDVLLAAEREPIDDLNAGYRRALEKLESDLQSAGKLQELLAVREELKKFIGGPDSYLPAESIDKDIAVPDLEKLRSTYRRERLRRNQEVARRSKAHLVTIKKELQGLQVELTKADRIEDALLAVQTIEAIDKRLTGIEENMVPAYLGDPIPKTKEQLEQFLVGTKWVSGWGAYLELLPEGNCRQSTMSPVGPWHAISSNRAVRRGAKGVPLEMIFNEDFESFIQPPGKTKVYSRLRLPAPDLPINSREELAEYLSDSVWRRADDNSETTLVFVRNGACFKGVQAGEWQAISSTTAQRIEGAMQIKITFAEDFRSFREQGPDSEGQARFNLIGMVSKSGIRSSTNSGHQGSTALGEGREAELIASLAGDWRLTTTGWEFHILEDGRVNAERQTGRIEVIDLDQRIVKMLGFDQTAIWKVSEDLKSMNGTGVKGGFRHPAKRR